MHKILHLVIAAYYVLVIWFDIYYVDLSVFSRPGDFKFFAGRLKFLTIWNMLLQASFFTVCTLNDVIGSNNDDSRNQPFIRRLKDVILACLAFPLSMFVGTTFWGLYAVDRELVFPKALDPYFPVWLNHVMHTNIMIFILIEMYTSFRKYPSRKMGIAILTLFMLLYLIWIHIIHAYSGFWVYPVLEVLNFPLRLVFFISLLLLAVSLYLVGEKLNQILWAKQLAKLEQQKRH